MRMLRVALLAGVAGLSSSPILAAPALKFGPAPAWVHQHALPWLWRTVRPWVSSRPII